MGVTGRTFLQPTSKGDRKLEVTLWYPGTSAPTDAKTAPARDIAPAEGARFPVVVYSHGGCGGDPASIEPLAVFLASRGFAFVQFPHPGSSRGDCASEGAKWAEALLERPDDIRYVLDALARLDTDSSWGLSQRLDPSRAGLLGHSQGGQVAFLLPVVDNRVRAAIAISPSVAHPDTPRRVWESVSRSTCPTLIIYGQRDSTWTVDGPRRAYEGLPPATPAGFLQIAGMGHTPAIRADVEMIERYVLAWLLRYLKSDNSDLRLLSTAATPDGVRFETRNVQ